MLKVVITYASTIFCSRSLITLEGLIHKMVCQYILLPWRVSGASVQVVSGNCWASSDEVNFITLSVTSTMPFGYCLCHSNWHLSVNEIVIKSWQKQAHFLVEGLDRHVLLHFFCANSFQFIQFSGYTRLGKQKTLHLQNVCLGLARV